MDFLVTELANHPGIFYTILFLLGSLLIALIRSHMKTFKQQNDLRFAELDDLMEKLNGRMHKVTSELSKVEKDMALSSQDLKGLHDSLNLMIEKIEVVSVNVTDIKLGQALLTQRVEGVEKKMPNGELRKLAEAFERLATK